MLCSFAIAMVAFFSCRRFSTLASPSPSTEESCYSTSGMARWEPSPCELFSRRARGVASPLATSSASFRCYRPPSATRAPADLCCMSVKPSWSSYWSICVSSPPRWDCGYNVGVESPTIIPLLALTWDSQACSLPGRCSLSVKVS